MKVILYRKPKVIESCDIITKNITLNHKSYLSVAHYTNYNIPKKWKLLVIEHT